MHRLPLLFMILNTTTHASVSSASLAARCKTTPALMLHLTDARAMKIASGGEYQLQAVRWDPLLQKRWAILRSCSQPDLPPRIVPLNGSQGSIAAEAQADSAPVFPVVHVGDLVHIRKREAMLQMELTGIADESGPIGGRIRVHVLRPADANIEQTGLGRKQLLAVVRGPAEVEMER